jgi:HSP20 family protein
MPSTKWDAAQELLKLHDRINRLFNMERQTPLNEDELITGSWTPACDILETKDAVVLRAELPGVRKEDIDISLEAGVLTLRGLRHLEKENEECTYHRIERSYGSFVRSFTLPRIVDSERISAKFIDGVLEIRMPRREENKPRSIQIDVRDGE